jgi:hypothetical protein
MSDQKLSEIIKALAYGKTAEQIAEAEDVEVSAIEQIAKDSAQDVEDEKAGLKAAGYLHE